MGFCTIFPSIKPKEAIIIHYPIYIIYLNNLMQSDLFCQTWPNYCP